MYIHCAILGTVTQRETITKTQTVIPAHISVGNVTLWHGLLPTQTLSSPQGSTSLKVALAQGET